jgi:hypothetical protein
MTGREVLVYQLLDALAVDGRADTQELSVQLVGDGGGDEVVLRFEVGVELFRADQAQRQARRRNSVDNTTSLPGATATARIRRIALPALGACDITDPLATNEVAIDRFLALAHPCRVSAMARTCENAEDQHRCCGYH